MSNGELLIVEEVSAPSTAQRDATSGPSIDWLQGIPLRTALQILGGYAGELKNPATGTVHQISLSKFEGRDLDNTFVRIAFRFVDPSKVGTTRKPS
jgi:hypothetical protein